MDMNFVDMLMRDCSLKNFLEGHFVVTLRRQIGHVTPLQDSLATLVLNNVRMSK